MTLATYRFLSAQQLEEYTQKLAESADAAGGWVVKGACVGAAFARAARRLGGRTSSLRPSRYLAGALALPDHRFASRSAIRLDYASYALE
jgi:hypothetical protein